jgi:hypothetical protein
MTDKMREEFEAWHRSVVEGDPPHEKYNSGDYRNQHVQRYWLGWQASRASLVIELPETIGVYAHPESDREWVLDPDDVRAAIEAAGLKVKP